MKASSNIDELSSTMTKNNKMKKNIICIYLLSMSVILSSCDKYLDIQPVGTVVPSTESDFRALLTSGYQAFPDHKAFLNLRTDELVLNEESTDLSSIKDIYIWNDQNPGPTTRSYAWLTFYKSIFYANHIIAEAEEKVGNSDGISQIRAEAYLMRAYSHFELLNSYAPSYNPATAASDKGVPISIKIDLEQKFVPASVEQVYQQILADIAAASSLIKVTDSPTNVKYRFSKRAIHAFEARMRLYRGEWQLAMDAAEKALEINANLEDLTKGSSLLPSNFESVEMIQSWENTGNSVVRNSTFISDELVGLYNVGGDLRFDRYFQNTDKDNPRYVSLKGGDNQFNVTFRNGELYLIVAEASLRLNNKTKAIDYLNRLLKNRLTPGYLAAHTTVLAGMTDAQLQSEIMDERARELALEGLRWDDLKRTDRRQVVHKFFGQDYILNQNDPRYVIRYPKEAVEKNPDL